MTTLLPILQAIAADQAGNTRGLDLGVVTDVFSNEGGSGDAQPSVSVQVRASALELQRIPVATGRIGLSMLPKVGDLVIVGYLGGDLNGAVVLGSLYDDQNQAPDAAPNEIVYEVPDGGEGGVRRVEMILDSAKKITIDEDYVEIALGGTSLRIEADGNVIIDAASGIKLAAAGNIELEAQGDIVASGANVSLEAQINAGIKANAEASLEASATAKVKGPIVTVGGVVQFSAS